MTPQTKPVKPAMPICSSSASSLEHKSVLGVLHGEFVEPKRALIPAGEALPAIGERARFPYHGVSPLRRSTSLEPDAWRRRSAFCGKKAAQLVRDASLPTLPWQVGKN